MAPIILGQNSARLGELPKLERIDLAHRHASREQSSHSATLVTATRLNPDRRDRNAEQSRTQTADGFGYYSMNLLSPIYPGISAIFPNFGNSPDATGGQYEGYNYLGLGVLFLLGVVSITVIFFERKQSLVRHLGLILVCVGLTAVAISNRIYWGSHEIADLGNLYSWIGQFRASGRFFWPAAYVILIGGVNVVSSLKRYSFSIAVLIIASILQFVDTSLLRGRAWARMHNGKDWTIDSVHLRPLLASHQHLAIYPQPCSSYATRFINFTQLLLSGLTIQSSSKYDARVPLCN